MKRSDGNNEDAMAPVLRQAAKLVVVGPDNRVLLFRYEDDRRTWWAAPGGGLEGDETFEEAAAREALEELSVTDAALTPLWCQTVEFRFRGESIRQVERFFLMRLARGETRIRDLVGEEHRREGIVASRWWSLEEIASTSERIFPEDLGERLQGLES
jgi:ADP-ribose pyrophosphatase YjhB (NUDIX family)